MVSILPVDQARELFIISIAHGRGRRNQKLSFRRQAGSFQPHQRSVGIPVGLYWHRLAPIS